MLALYLLTQLDSDRCVIFCTPRCTCARVRPEFDESVIPMHELRVQT